jgi:hypothetical protein
LSGDPRFVDCIVTLPRKKPCKKGPINGNDFELWEGFTLATQLRLEYAGAISYVMSRRDRQEAIFWDDEELAAVFENAKEGRSAKNGIGGGAAKTDGDVDGVDCQRTQRRRAEKCLECDEEVAGQG